MMYTVNKSFSEKFSKDITMTCIKQAIDGMLHITPC